MDIQLFVPAFRVDECLEGIRECLEKGWTGLGFKTVQFEEDWKKYTGYRHAHFLNSATAGLHLAVRVLKDKYGWTESDEIISTPLTFISTNHAIMYENLKIVFADVDESLCLDPVDVEKKITERTKAVMFVGLGGNVGKYREIVQLCKKHNLKLILDAAHMAGTKLDGKLVFEDADVVVYSFQAVKNLPTADSGMICFRDKEDDETCRKLTWLGINKDTYTRTHEKGGYKFKYDVEGVGFKYHGNSIMAAIGIVQLRYLEEDNNYRAQLANWYEEGLLPHKDIVQCIPMTDGCQSSRHLFVIKVADRDGLLTALNKAGIYPGVHYVDNTTYSMYHYGNGTCPVSHHVSEHILSLPMYLKLSKENVAYICEEVIKYCRDAKNEG